VEVEFDSILFKKLISSGEFFSKIMPILKDDYFHDIGKHELFKLFKNFYNEYREIPSVIELVASVKNVPNSEIRKEIVQALKIINSIEEPKNLEFMLTQSVQWVKDVLYYKALQIGSDGLMKKDESLKLKAQQIMDERSKVSIDSDLGLDFDDIDKMISYYSQRNIGVKTQHVSLNKRLGDGFIPGTISFILAAAGIGKCSKKSDLINIYIPNEEYNKYKARLDEMRIRKSMEEKVV